MVNGITVDGTQMAEERQPLMWGFVNMLHSQVQRLDRAVDRIVPDMKDLETAQDGAEVKAWELQLLTDKAQNLGDRRDAFEKMRDLAADAYRAETGDTWRPRHGSHTSHTGQLISAAIDARDFRRARQDRETRAHLPDGTHRVRGAVGKARDRVARGRTRSDRGLPGAVVALAARLPLHLVARGVANRCPLHHQLRVARFDHQPRRHRRVTMRCP